MDDEFKYPWQQKVLEAFLASPDTLAAKINIAERAIAARLIDGQEPDVIERIALDDALRALRVLLAETRPATARPDGREREDIA